MKQPHLLRGFILGLSALIMIAAAWLAFPPGPDEAEEDITTSQEAERINQAPVAPIIEREGKVVRIEMTAQRTDIEISDGVIYNAWTFNGTVPGPVLRVMQGDLLQFTLVNMDPEMPHSMDFHAVHAAPSRKFIEIMPDEQGTFEYPADTPGVFMYHCGASPVLLHVANGMYGTIIVEPEGGYETDHEIDQSYTLVQSEWYAENDLDDFQHGDPEYVVFNGDDFSHKEKPLLAKVGDKVRLYVMNAGPNHVSSFHVVGTTFDRVYLDGNPQNVLYGMQTVLIPAGGGAVVEFTVTEDGDYPVLTHQLNDAFKGAIAILRATHDGQDHGEATMSH